MGTDFISSQFCDNYFHAIVNLLLSKTLQLYDYNHKTKSPDNKDFLTFFSFYDSISIPLKTLVKSFHVFKQ